MHEAYAWQSYEHLPSHSMTPRAYTIRTAMEQCRPVSYYSHNVIVVIGTTSHKGWHESTVALGSSALQN